VVGQYHPTAQALVDEVALTADRESKLALGFGVWTFDQAMPFQRKISVAIASQALDLHWFPTAHALVDEVALTATGDPEKSEAAKFRALLATVSLLLGAACAAGMAETVQSPAMIAVKAKTDRTQLRKRSTRPPQA